MIHQFISTRYVGEHYGMAIIFFTLLLFLLTSSCKHTRQAHKSSKSGIYTFTPTGDSSSNTESTDKLLPKSNFFWQTNDIKNLQIWLYLNNYAPGRADGTWKQQTLDALLAYQIDQHLAVGDTSYKTYEHIGLAFMDFDVSQLQQALADKGYDPGAVDNAVGPLTRSAFIQFLAANQLNSTMLTPELKTAIFSTDVKYRNKADVPTLDPLFTQETLNTTTTNNLQFSLNNISVYNVMRALQAWGYDTGSLPQGSTSLTPRAKNALFRFQIDRQLPIGDINEETLRELGFR